MTEVALRDYVREIDGMIENSAYDAAIQHSRHILQHFPKYVEVYRVLGKALLEKGDDAAAADVFQRVLSVDPEDFVARVGLSIIHDRANELEPAIWHMERAFDLMPSNEIIQSELRRLYARRDGVEPERVSLTRSALARMYAHGDLYDEAITNLRQLLHDQPERLDLKVLLTEVLWRDDQRVDAADLAQIVLKDLPYCLKANLIYGELLHDGGNVGDSNLPFARAQAADPDNIQATRLFGAESPLPVKQTLLARLEQPSYVELLEAEGAAAESEEVPDWLRGLAELNTPANMLEPPESASHAPLATGLHMPSAEPQRSDIPEWLQGLSVPQPEPAEPAGEIPSWLTQLGAESASPTPEMTAAVPADDWLNQLQTTAPAEPAAAKDEEVPDWIRQLGTGELKSSDLPVVEPAAEETPDWLAQLGGFKLSDQATTEGVSPEESGADSTIETSDWLSQLGAAASSEPATLPEATESAETPDWLQAMRASESAAETTEPPAASGEGEMPDWLAELRSSAPPLTESTAPGETSDWLAQLRTAAPEIEEPLVEEEPSAEVTPRFGVDADRATVNRLIEAFEAETPAEQVAAVPEIYAEIEEPLLEQPAAEVTAEIEAAPVAEAPSEMAAETLAEMPSADDALAFLARLAAGKEDQLRAEAEQEGESRMAAIMGRKPVEPEKPIEPAPEPEQAGPALGEIVTPVAEAGAGLVGLAGLAAAGVARAVRGDEEAAPAPEAEPVMEAAPAFEAAPAAELPQEMPAEISDEMPSADDALAFLARLAAGKEEQLRAEAEQEGESRMAAIMGRKPTQPLKSVEPEQPIEPEPASAPEPEPEVAELVAEMPAEVSAEMAAEMPEEMPSADDALAFLARLAAGKEDQLRAEAEQEGESRMAAIMGRKPTQPLKSVEPEQPIEPETASAPAPEPEPAAIEPEQDWLSQLAVMPSFEAAEPTAEGDMPDWLRALQPDAEEGAETAPLEAAAPTPESELPAWLHAMQPAEEPEIGGEIELAEAGVEGSVEPAEPLAGSELPGWLSDLRPTEEQAAPTPSEELPEWLRAMQPGAAETVGEQEPAPEPVADEAAVEFAPEPAVRVVESETAEVAAPVAVTPIAPTPVEETAVAEVASTEVQSTPVGSMDWWTQVATDEDEAPLTELPPVVKIASATGTPSGRTPAARPSREREPLRRPERLERPIRDLRSRAQREREAKPTPPPVPAPAPAASVNVDPLVAQLEADKYNHTVRLELARAWWSMGNRESASAEYAKLINPAALEDLSPEELAEREEFDFADAGPLADDIIVDLERIVEIDDQPDWLRLLGDIHMKVGNLARALEMYRRALNQL